MITTFLVVILVVASVTILWSFMSMFLISTGESGESAFANFLSLLSPKEEENENLEEGEDLNVDLDGEGRVLGIEILDASKNLPSSALKSAILV